MLSSVVSRSARLTAPLVLFTACIVAGLESPRLDAGWLNAVTAGLPFIMFSVAVLLSLKFNISRYTLLSLLLGLVYLLSQGYFPPVDSDYLLAGYTLLSINLIALSLCRDRSLLSLHGVYKLLAVLIQGLLVWALVANFPVLFAQLVFFQFIDIVPASLIEFHIPDFLLMTFLLALPVHAFLSIKSNSPIQATFFGCQLALLFMLSDTSVPHLAPLAAASGFLLVTLSIVLNSYDMAFRDDLTKLPSRRCLNQLLLSLGNKYVIAMLDIDHFKKFNDTHGHDIGDEVLKMVATKIGAVSGGGKPFRYGGEEFTVVFPGKTVDQVESHLDQLRDSIENYIMVVRDSSRAGLEKGSGKKERVPRSKNNPKNKTLSVTISIGYAPRSNINSNAEQVIKAADEALYRAKDKGRNCISA